MQAVAGKAVWIPARAALGRNDGKANGPACESFPRKNVTPADSKPGRKFSVFCKAHLSPAIHVRAPGPIRVGLHLPRLPTQTVQQDLPELRHFEVFPKITGLEIEHP